MKAIIRLRGSKRMKRQMEDTLKMLNLTRVNHCCVVPDNESSDGMVKRVKDFVTWGEISEDTLAKMIEKRGRLPGDEKLDKDWLKENGFDSFETLAKDIIKGDVKIKELDIKPIFRLSPPSKGMKSKKAVYPKGSLGNRGEEVNELLERMI